MEIKFQEQTKYCGYNGVGKMAGLCVGAWGDIIELRPINTRGATPSTWMNIPKSSALEIAQALIDLSQA